MVISKTSDLLSETSLTDLRTSLKQCTRCSLGCLPDRRATPVPSSGPLDAEIVIIARNPGRVEDQNGRPLIGPGGQILTQFLESCGINRDECYITNLAMCYSWKDRKPVAAEYNTCSIWKKMEFQLVRPKIVMLFGNDVYHYFYPSLKNRSTVTDHGHVFKGFEIPDFGMNDFSVFVTCHPGFVIRRRDLMSQIWGVDIAIVQSLLRINNIKRGVIS